MSSAPLSLPPFKRIAIMGGGPVGLMAAEVLLAGSALVDLRARRRQQFIPLLASVKTSKMI